MVNIVYDEPVGGEHSFMLMSIPGGNAINAWNDEQAALDALARILKEEPEAAPHMVLVEFDSRGLPTRILYGGSDGFAKTFIQEQANMQAPEDRKGAREYDPTAMRREMNWEN